MDQPIVHRALTAVRLGLLALLAAVGWRAARRGGARAYSPPGLWSSLRRNARRLAALLGATITLIAAPGFLLNCRYGIGSRDESASSGKTLAFSACGLLWMPTIFCSI